jgi:phosphatidylglycerophosphatase A
LNFVEKLLGSGFYTGYIPIASGTFASLVALMIYFIPGFENNYIIFSFIILSTSFTIYIGSKFEILYGKDPHECTIDEFVGMWISLLFLPKNILLSIIVFLIWRILDILKPYPANKLENLKGGLGIVADDIVAGIYTCIISNIGVYYFKFV